MNRRQSYWRRNLVLPSATLGLQSSADFRQPKVTDRHRASVMHPTSASALIHGGLSAWSSYHLMGSWAKACPTVRGFACVVREKVGADRHPRATDLMSRSLFSTKRTRSACARIRRCATGVQSRSAAISCSSSQDYSRTSRRSRAMLRLRRTRLRSIDRSGQRSWSAAWGGLQFRSRPAKSLQPLLNGR